MNVQKQESKIVSIAMVKNESDIIEFYVRYNLKFLDEMYIVEHQSNDRTLEILEKMKLEGLPIHVFKYNSYGYDQGAILTTIVNKIKENKAADYILLFDADQYIVSDSRESFVNELTKEETSFHITEYDYMLKNTDIEKDVYIYEKMIYKAKIPFHIPKSIINLNLYYDGELWVGEGGHHFYYSGPIKGNIKRLENSFLAHLQYRSQEQLYSKILIGCLSYMIRNVGVTSVQIGNHWFDPYHHLIHTERIKNIPLKTITELDIMNDRVTILPLVYDNKLLYTKMNEINALRNIKEFLFRYIEYNNDTDNYKEIIEKINNIDVSDNVQAIIEVVRIAEKYILDKGIKAFKINDLEEIKIERKSDE